MKKIFVIILLLFLGVISGCKEDKIYEIEYDFDSGTTLDECVYKFSDCSEVVLPVAIKDGYIFAGWSENNIFLDELTENRNYKLKAEWFLSFDFQTIDEVDFFMQEEDNYLIYVYKDDCKWCDKIHDDILKYLYITSLEQYNSSYKLYILNLFKNGEKISIYRDYLEESGQGSKGKLFIDDCTTYEELYLSSVPCLISVETVDNIKKSKLIALGASNVSDTLQTFIKYR